MVVSPFNLAGAFAPARLRCFELGLFDERPDLD
jgi:hypothetical protein